jgi:hemin uptake protein HemP
MSQRNTVLPAPTQPPSTCHAVQPPHAGAPPRWSSRELLAGGREAEIEHDKVVYRLRITSLGKLILTK